MAAPSAPLHGVWRRQVAVCSECHRFLTDNGVWAKTHGYKYELDGKSLDGRTFGARQING
jgi:hypothetical protein